MKTKFNCVEMKHESARKIREKISNYSLDEELKFWEKRSIDLKVKKEKILHGEKANRTA